MEELTQAQLKERASILSEGYEGKGWEERPKEEVDVDLNQNVELNQEASAEELKEENNSVEENTDDEGHAEYPQEIIDTISALQQKVDSFSGLQDRLRKSESHIGNLLRELKEKKEKKAPSQEEIEAAAKEKESLDMMDEDYPGFQNALKRVEGKIPDIDSFRSEIENEFNQKLESANRSIEQRIVSVAHNDWIETVNSPEFKAWSSDQSGDIATWLQSDKAEDVIKVLDSFKGSGKVEDIKKKREKQLELATTQKSKSRAVKTKTEADMTPAELRRYLVDQGYKDG